MRKFCSKIWILIVFALHASALWSVDYQELSNWVICNQADAAPAQKYDLFYIYPTLASSKECALMDWKNPALAAKTQKFVRTQCAVFQEDARIFAPYVRQLEYSRCARELMNRVPWEKSEMQTGIQDTVEAFRYYLKHFNQGRPFLLLGHSQGAMDLYMMLKNCPEISVSSGFVAAYLIGLPGLTHAQMEADFRGRAIRSAAGADDLGVIAGWNTQSPDAVPSIFAVPGGVCINPLNWRTDEVAAEATSNAGAILFDYRSGKTEKIRHFCGAVVDRSKGALIVDLPVLGQYDAKGFMGRGIFHMNDFWFFAENIRNNARLRAEKWLSQRNAGAIQ